VSYGSSDESDLSDHEEEDTKVSQPFEEATKVAKTISAQSVDAHISDEDEPPTTSVGGFDIDDEDEAGNFGTSIFASLAPAASKPMPPPDTKTHKVDQNEDLSTIPVAKTYTEQQSEPDLEPPPAKKVSRWSNQARKARREGMTAGGAVKKKIMAPSVRPVSDSDSDDPAAPSKGPVLPKKSSELEVQHSLFSMLPKPKNDFTYKPAAQPKLTDPSGPSSKPRAPLATTTVSMMPRTVKKAVANSHKEDPDDEETTAFFSFDRRSGPAAGSAHASSASLPVMIKANPEATAPQDRPLDGLSTRPTSSQFSAEVYGPQPGTSTGGYDDANDLMSNRDQIERLQGRLKKRGQMQEELANIVEVNQSDLTADPREWMTKAMTEDVEAPGPRNTIGGQTKRKHQITYLAAMAKEKEQELKKQWSDNAAARRAAGNKYGF